MLRGHALVPAVWQEGQAQGLMLGGSALRVRSAPSTCCLAAWLPGCLQTLMLCCGASRAGLAGAQRRRRRHRGAWTR